MSYEHIPEHHLIVCDQCHTKAKTDSPTGLVAGWVEMGIFRSRDGQEIVNLCPDCFAEFTRWANWMADGGG